MKLRAKNLPSVTSRPGRITAETSRWPQGCGRYQAAVTSGAVDLATLTGNWPLVSSAVVHTVAVASAAIVQVVVAVGMTPASDASIPPGVPISVSGVSADTENEPPNGTAMV